MTRSAELGKRLVAMKISNNEVEGSSLLHHTAHIIRTMNLLDMNFILRIDYCSFSNKITTRAEIKKLRHFYLQGNVLVISERFHEILYNIKQNILGQKVKVKGIE